MTALSLDAFCRAIRVQEVAEEYGYSTAAQIAAVSAELAGLDFRELNRLVVMLATEAARKPGDGRSFDEWRLAARLFELGKGLQ